MSLSLSLDNRKYIERRMNLRPSTVNQRLMDNWNRENANHPLQLDDALEITHHQRVINKCESVQEQAHSERVSSARNKTIQGANNYDSLEGIIQDQIVHNSDHISSVPNSICDKINGSVQFNRCLTVENDPNILSNVDCVQSRSQAQGSAINHDLIEPTSKQHFNPMSSELILNHSPSRERRRRIQVLDILSKRIKSTSCSEMIEESQSDREVVCSCRDKSIEGSGTMPAGAILYDTDSYTGSSMASSQTNSGSRNRILVQPHKLVSLSERNGRAMCHKHMPWFGIDVGGSLVKVVFFDPKDATKEETVTLKRIRRYLKSSKAYGTTGKRDAHLEMPNCIINKRAGTLHFIRFATNQMPEFLAMAKNKRFADTINNVCATGGGANKFEEDIKSNLGITLHKTDELDSIIHGIHYIDKYNSERECYFLKNPLDDDKCVKVPYDFSRPYPYLVVNIGSGVSILAVYSSTSYSRISGSSIGGGTFLGLCCLLTQCKTFDEAIRLANNGSSNKIDKLVKDIYGGDYPKFNLSGDTVASSFGHMNVAEKRKGVKREDLARALLEMVTINIGSISRMCAVNENIDRVVFIGNFLRVNQLSMKLLSYAVNYWSKGAIKALFLEHEGYFGAVGCFVESTNGCCDN